MLSPGPFARLEACTTAWRRANAFSTPPGPVILDAMPAIKARLLGDYKRGEERMLILAIRRETGLELPDGEIRDVLIEAANDDTTALGVFERLLMLETISDEEFAVTKPR
jgi:hypothetical protein